MKWENFIATTQSNLLSLKPTYVETRTPFITSFSIRYKKRMQTEIWGLPVLNVNTRKRILLSCICSIQRDAAMRSIAFV